MGDLVLRCRSVAFNNRLTLSAGLRYDFLARPTEVNGIDRISYDCDCNNIAPRLGAALRLPDRWGILRTAAGVHFGDIFPVTYSQVRFSPPGSVKFAIPAADLLNPVDSSQARGNSTYWTRSSRRPIRINTTLAGSPNCGRHGSWNSGMSAAGRTSC